MNLFAITRESALSQSVKTLILACTVLTLSACGFRGDTMPEKQADTVDYAVISNNLVDALSQYTRLNPRLAIVQVAPPANNFETQVQQEMVDRGYKLEKVKTGELESAKNGVHALIQDAGQNDTDPLFVLSIGNVSAERRFDTEQSSTLPTSELVIRGGEKRAVVLNDDQIFDVADTSLSKVAFRPAAVATQVVVPQPEVVAQRKSSPTPTVPAKPAPVQWNMYDTMQSNFVSLFEEYEDVDSSILVFPNDSLRLGEGNKQIIEEYVSKMDPETDVLSVIGCSHGATAIDNGNSLLAIGRANRVKEAFLFSGVEHEHVMDEGCWAPQTFDEMMPRRGVVLTLKRRKNS